MKKRRPLDQFKTICDITLPTALVGIFYFNPLSNMLCTVSNLKWESESSLKYHILAKM